MRITQMDRLQRDLHELISTRKGLQEIKEHMCIGKTVTLAWLRYKLQFMICDIDHQIGMKKEQIADAEIRRRLGEEEIDYDEAEMGNRGGTAVGETDHRTAADHGGRGEAGAEQKCERAGGQRRRRNKLEQVGTVRAMAEKAVAAVGSAEICLRARYRERHEDALMDWQREVMEEDRNGIRGRLTI